MMVLNEEAMGAVDYFHTTYCPKYEDLEIISNGGDNIRFAPPGNDLDKWGSLIRRSLSSHLLNKLVLSSIIIGRRRQSLRWSMKLHMLLVTWVMSRTTIPRRLMQIFFQISQRLNRRKWRSTLLLVLLPSMKMEWCLLLGLTTSTRSTGWRKKSRKMKRDSREICMLLLLNISSISPENFWLHFQEIPSMLGVYALERRKPCLFLEIRGSPITCFRTTGFILVLFVWEVLQSHQRWNQHHCLRRNQNEFYKDYLPDEAIIKICPRVFWTGIPSLFQKKKPLKSTRKIPRTKEKIPELMLPFKEVVCCHSQVSCFLFPYVWEF